MLARHINHYSHLMKAPKIGRKHIGLHLIHVTTKKVTNILYLEHFFQN